MKNDTNSMICENSIYNQQAPLKANVSNIKKLYN